MKVINYLIESYVDAMGKSKGTLSNTQSIWVVLTKHDESYQMKNIVHEDRREKTGESEHGDLRNNK